jgi:hypothetical protein
MFAIAFHPIFHALFFSGLWPVSFFVDLRKGLAASQSDSTRGIARAGASKAAANARVE